MTCPYYKESSSRLGNVYGYCTVEDKNGDPVSSDEYYEYCRQSERYYTECPRYASANGSICFITQAVCGLKRMPDHCYIMETLRRFRDEHLTESETQAYYDSSKAVVPYIQKQDAVVKNKLLNYIMEKVTQAVELIETGKRAEAHAVYIDVMTSLNAMVENG